MLTIELGNGDTVITDILGPEAKWAGVCFTRHECPVGTYVDMGADTDIEMGAFFRIVATDPKSLDVLIAACERAKALIS